MPRISGAQRGSGVQAVVFALEILEFIAQHQGSVGVTELARAFDTTKSRMHRHLQTLMTAGYLVRDPQTERYRVSARLVALGQAVSEGFEFARAARDVTRELRDKLGHAVVLSQTEDQGIRIILLVPSRSSVEVAVKPGSVLAFHASAQGKIALAFGDPSLSQRVLAGELPRSTAYTIGDPGRLQTEIDLTRKRGWAAAPNESVIGLNALAAPAFDALGHYAGAIAIVDSIQFIADNPSIQQVQELTEAAAQISRNLGYRGSQPVYADKAAMMRRAGGGMTEKLGTAIGALPLKNPVIAGPAEHLIDPDNVRRALRTGVGAVVLKSTNESDAAREQLERAEYAAFDELWREVPWGSQAPRAVTIATRSGLARIPFDQWLEQAATFDREAKLEDAYAIPSIIVADLDRAVEMALMVEQAGLRALELNIGTPYAREAQPGALTTEFDPARATGMVASVTGAVSIPVWVKLTGQSERVPDLVQASFDGGGDAVIMAGRMLGLIPDVETMQPALGTSLGIGGFWNLPLTCHWLALSRARMGPDKPLIGINGAQSGLDVARMMLAGAHAVEIASAAMLRGFQALSDALAEFDAYLTRKQLRATDLVGRAADTRKSFASLPPLADRWKDYVPKQ